MKAIYPGSFDPITYGHVDIISRARQIFDELVIVIMVNDEKSGSFTMDERLEMVRECIRDYDNVSVVIGNGLTVDFARKIGATVLVRGIRAVSDYEYELQIADINHDLSGIETVVLFAQPGLANVSSSIIRELAHYGRDIREWLPEDLTYHI